MRQVGSLKVLALKGAIHGGTRLISGMSDRQLLSLMKPVLSTVDSPVGRTFLERLIVLSKRAVTDCSPECRRRWVGSFLGNVLALSSAMRQSESQRLGFHPPVLMVLSPTMRCNLQCAGCYSSEYRREEEMDFDTLLRLVDEAKAMGTYFVVISGGEPYIRKDLLDLYEAQSDAYFLTFTNGTLIDDAVADRLGNLGNVLPCFSVEGFKNETDERRGPGVYEKVLAAMDRCRDRGILFGFSATATRANNELIVSDEFVDFYASKGCFVGWYFQYLPVGRSPDVDLVPTAKQRDYRREQLNELRERKSILLADFWNDGPLTDGCIAAGREYFHVNSKGDVEPCVFAHFAIDNVHETSLEAALGSRLFRAIRDRQPYHHNFLRPCMIIDIPDVLREVVKESGARPTHPGAEDILDGPIAREVDRVAAEYGEIADRKWKTVCLTCARSLEPAGGRGPTSH